MTTPSHHRPWLYLLFAISGFSGLIYESIWSHYLKLFLGHAAYAQTLVLAIFMGGMAIGAWIPSRFGGRWKNLLWRYAMVEGVIGLGAVIFHQVFVGATDLAYDSLIPALATPWAVTLLKWSLAALLILPQSILLGMTFPLMSASLIRRYPSDPGTSLAMLYFTNSLGAAIGVLIAGFILIEAVGLPGTILTAGLINIAVALVAWSLAKGAPEPPPARVLKKSARHDTMASWRLLIAASFLTGAASFIYEIGWIRMLSLVLGSSTHAFELMLSAFIVGLAFGGLWIRYRIDDLKEPTRFLGFVQVAMGALALVTLVAYKGSFDAMQMLLHSVTRTEGGYFLFNLASHTIAIVIMVPVTFCAGMTLPLITHTLLGSGHGEKSIGAVYAANTLGAIVGVFLAVHVGLPVLGLKGLVMAGAVIDMALGIALLTIAAKLHNRRPAWIAALLAATAIVVALFGIQLDHRKMASGIYRVGAFTPTSAEMLYHQDGKTATVDLLKLADGNISIRTNGKTDAQMTLYGDAHTDSDESTMILLGAVPLLHRPDAHTAANIGMGSGLTTHVLLGSTTLERVDTVEIEPAMIEAANGFRPRVERTFTDSRSHLHVEDAKTFFSAQRRSYDIIVAEPSNPWVSGVASLFSDEFYHRTSTHLNPNGLFVQWLQLYEIDINLVASIMKAIGRNFSDYVLYMANDVDLVIVAAKQGAVPTVSARALTQGNLGQELGRIGIHTLQELALGRVGDKKLLEPLFDSILVPANSDFFPIVDLHAVRARYLKAEARELLSLTNSPLSVREMLGWSDVDSDSMRPTPREDLSRTRHMYDAMVLRDFYREGRLRKGDSLESDLLRHALFTQKRIDDCREPYMSAMWFESISKVMNSILGYLKSSEAELRWRRFGSSDCVNRITSTQRDIFKLYGAIARRDTTNMTLLAERLLDGRETQSNQVGYLLSTGMLGYLASNRPQEAMRLFQKHAPRISRLESSDGVLRLLWAHSLSRIKSGLPAKAAPN